MTDYLHALPPGYRIEKYELVRVLDSGGFGITYLGYDHHLDKAVAIKEYLPNDLAVRTDNNSVLPKSTQDRADYEWGLERFLSEAQTLARFDHRHIIKIHRFFRAHGTGYSVMEYAEGETLSKVLQRKGTLTEAELKAILFPILDGLEAVHEADFLHRDIKPGNIVIRDDGSPVLIDFGSARQAVAGKSRSVTAIVTPGYAPIEQYSAKGHQGPWTDIYGLGAVCYRCLAGEPPDDATERLREDPLVPAAQRCASKASKALLDAIDRALRVNEEERPQTIAAWRKMLAGDGNSGKHTTQTGANKQAETQMDSIDMEVKLPASDEAWDDFKRGEDAYSRRNYPKAARWFRKAAEQGYAEAQFRLGRMYADSEEDVIHDHAEAERWFRKAAEQGHEDAQYRLGFYDRGEVVVDDDTVTLRKAAKQGYAEAQFNLGKMYYDRGVDRGHAEMVDRSWAYAMCGPSEGTVRDYAKAGRWFRKAAEQGYAKAQDMLGTMYYSGQGVMRDHAEAAQWLRKAAEQGYAAAQDTLGLMYKYGEGVMKDDTEAVRWLRKAAEQGHAKAQFHLGKMYANGDGVPKDYVQAYAWVSIAVVTDDDYFDEEDLNDIANSMTPEQIAKAQELSREYRKAYSYSNW